MTKPIRIAVDIGGTFTDLQVLDARSGAVHAWLESALAAEAGRRPVN